MPPKKEVTKATTKHIARPPISDSSLVVVPTDVFEGFQDRLEACVEWTVIEEACRLHQKRCKREDKPKVTFTEAFQKKLDNSVLRGFLDEESTLSLQDHWEMLLPLLVWDSEKCANDEAKICFQNANSFTEDIMDLIKQTVRHNDRNILREGLFNVHTLRINDAKVTHLDEGLQKFKHLITLNLSGNFISTLKAGVIPLSVKLLELQANAITQIEMITERIPTTLAYLGLSRNLLNDEGIIGLHSLPHKLTVLDLANNDILELLPLLSELSAHPNIVSLNLYGNPCSLCMGYARTVTSMMPNLRWLDLREILPTDRPEDPYEPHPDDLRSTYFTFSILRIMSPPIPPKTEKGIVQAFHVEIEIPLLDVNRRQFLFFRNKESLTEMMPEPEASEYSSSGQTASDARQDSKSKTAVDGENTSITTDIFAHLVTKSSREIIHYTVFESSKLPWNKIMTFQEPVVRIFCPDLFALRNTFRSVLTVRFVYTQTFTNKGKAPSGKSAVSIKQPPAEQRLVLATIRCALQQPDWSQPQQHFHWDDSLGTEDAIHWGDGNLAVLQYAAPSAKKETKGAVELIKQNIPDNLTCHFSFAIDTLNK